jgi:hypothetical protein
MESEKVKSRKSTYKSENISLEKPPPLSGRGFFVSN